MNKHFLKVNNAIKLSTLGVVALTTTSCGGEEQTIAKQPNVIFVLLDDLGYSQVAFNSNRITEDDYDPALLEFTIKDNKYSPKDALEFSRKASPTLTRMASNGVMFTNAYTSSNLSAASRAGIATGINQNRWGIYRNGDCETVGFADNTLLVERLHENGYATAHVGKWHIGVRDSKIVDYGRDSLKLKGSELNAYKKTSGFIGSCVDDLHALNNGFDYYYGYNMYESPFYRATNVWDGKELAPPNDTYSTDLFTDKALCFIDKSIDEDKPFYVQLNLHAVHDPLDVETPEKYSKQFNSDSRLLNIFYSHIFAVDENVRRIEEHLKERGVADNTIIVFTTDNGGAVRYPSPMPGNAPFRGNKGSYLVGGIRVPLFIYWPDGIKKSQINNNLVSTLDIIPTAIAAAGLDIPDNIDGKSLVPYLRNETNEPIREYLFWSGVHARNWGFRKTTVVKGRTRYEAPYSWRVIRNDGISLQYIAETDKNLYTDLPNGLPERYRMFNVFTDPSENNNLYSKENKDAKELKALWEDEARFLPPPALKSNYEDWITIMPKENYYIQGRK